MIHTTLADGSRGPTAFDGPVRPIDCIAVLDGTIEDAERLFASRRLPERVDRGTWRLGRVSITIREDGSKYSLEFVTDDAVDVEFEEKLDVGILPKLATRILRTFEHLA